jgi:hypothetical protein
MVVPPAINPLLVLRKEGNTHGFDRNSLLVSFLKVVLVVLLVVLGETRPRQWAESRAHCLRRKSGLATFPIDLRVASGHGCPWRTSVPLLILSMPQIVV